VSVLSLSLSLSLSVCVCVCVFCFFLRKESEGRVSWERWGSGESVLCDVSVSVLCAKYPLSSQSPNLVGSAFLSAPFGPPLSPVLSSCAVSRVKSCSTHHSLNKSLQHTDALRKNN